jgi:hypothetical protein
MKKEGCNAFNCCTDESDFNLKSSLLFGASILTPVNSPQPSHPSAWTVA